MRGGQSSMHRFQLTVCAAIPLLFASACVYAADTVSKAKGPLDVTMDIVPLNADVEKSVVQNITVPESLRPAVAPRKVPVPSAGAASRTTVGRPDGSVKHATTEEIHDLAARQAAQARREAAEAAAEARKDRNNSSAPDNDEPPPG